MMRSAFVNRPPRPFVCYGFKNTTWPARQRPIRMMYWFDRNVTTVGREQRRPPHAARANFFTAPLRSRAASSSTMRRAQMASARPASLSAGVM